MTSKEKDRNFDSIATKFSKNIYGKSKGRLRQDLLFFYLNQHLNLNSEEYSKLNILDAGGGTGVMSKALLELGHQVTLADVSSDCIEQAISHCEGLEGLKTLNSEIIDLESSQRFDLVLCHAVMEWLSEPYESLEYLTSLVEPGGYLSLSFFNKDAHLFGNVLYGNFEYIDNNLSVKNRVALNPQNPLKPADVIAFINGLEEVDIVHTAGIRCFHDYLKPVEFQETRYDELKAIELRYGTNEPFKWLGKYFHILLKKAG